jgi:hypothetical protein
MSARRPGLDLVNFLSQRHGAVKRFGIVALVIGLLVAILGLLAPAASASPLSHPETRVAAIEHPAGQIVGPHSSVLAVQGRERAPNYDRSATGSSVAAEGGAAGARFITNSAGDTLDTNAITIPEGKFGYLLDNPSKAGVFSDSMGFDKTTLDQALRNQLIDNFGDASPSEPMYGGGSKFSVTAPITGPSGQTWNITTAWGVDPDGTVRLITATP